MKDTPNKDFVYIGIAPYSTINYELEKSLEESLVGRDITAECGRILFSATDIYDILQVDRNADDRTVRGAYFRIMKQCHPDKVPREFAELATKAMAKVNDAFESYKTSRRTQ